MAARWVKLGSFLPEPQGDWMVSHASNPCAEPLGGSMVRIFFSPRDAQNRAHIAELTMDLADPHRTMHVTERPMLAPGERGYFDDSGVTMGSVLRVNGRRYLYYYGWNLGVTVPFRNFIGLAIDNDDLQFVKASRAPVVDRSPIDPLCLGYPWVIHDEGRWKLWYGSVVESAPKPFDLKVVLKYAESADGVHWERNDHIAIPLGDGDRIITRPCVIRDPDRYRMWFTVRDERVIYRIGYAESRDGLTWDRRDGDVGITTSESGWDSDSVEYPNVFDAAGGRYMVYNGNGFGRTGFGLAILERD
jgi:hypothetical protein